MKPLIGISVHTGSERSGDGIPEVRYRLTAQYCRAVVDAGGTPALIPTHFEYAGRAEDVLCQINGLLLSGGGGDRASYFSGGARPSLRQTNPERYDYEVALVRIARAQQLPILGICRGYQTLVEAEGGQLFNSIDDELPTNVGHDQQGDPRAATHTISIAHHSHLAQLLGPSIQVNSFHRQGVKQAPSKYTVSARTDDGLIEAVEAMEGFAWGVQFHPEWLYWHDMRFLEIFKRFVEASRANS